MRRQLIRMGAELAFRDLHGEAGNTWAAASDAALLDAATRRIQPAFSVLVSRYYKDVYRVVWRLSAGHADAQDITQEAFMRLWAKPDQLREAQALKGWLMRVASNMVMDRFRQKPMEDMDAAGEVAEAFRQSGFEVEEFGHSLNARFPGSRLRVQNHH